MVEKKVFCVGFQKTGTTSLKCALQTLGYRVAGVFGREWTLEQMRENYVETGLQIAAAHDAVQDMPWPLMFRQLDAAFSGSRFILTVRETDRWFKSIVAHFGSTPHHISQNTYGEDSPCPVGHEQRYKEVYETHNRAVFEYFKDRPGDLLVMDLERSCGWQELCPFVGEPVPSLPFFRTNTAAERRTLLYRVRKWLPVLRARREDA